ncbi:hypothetical protein AMK59_2859 [Oryctes borbonicus]|uniref:Uncharacterized protein n=1 Tax=Oryctes borbonicus TaxID=1629725 RepID=A0A0T6BGK8_9SCAR|nr:hypothetical protein AMK59_2859 [Oryctes borbonicus]
MAKQTPGSKCDTGSKYELSVTALFIALLSKNANVEDYRIFSNLAEAQPFNDIVAEVQFKGSKQTQICAIQVKSGKDNLNVNKYCNGYDKIIVEGGLKFGDSARNDRISFWYFCSKSPTKKTFPLTRKAGTVDLKLKPRCGPCNLHESIFDKTVSHELFSENSI